MGLNGLQCYGRGNLVSEPELKTIGAKGTSVVNVSVAFNRSYKKGDEWSKDVIFLEVTAFNGLAKRLNGFKKGDSLFITGTLTDSSYKNSDGKKVTKHRLLVDGIEGIAKNEQRVAKEETQQPSGPEVPQQDSGFNYEEDIPF